MADAGVTSEAITIAKTNNTIMEMFLIIHISSSWIDSTRLSWI